MPLPKYADPHHADRDHARQIADDRVRIFGRAQDRRVIGRDLGAGERDQVIGFEQPGGGGGDGQDILKILHGSSDQATARTASI